MLTLVKALLPKSLRTWLSARLALHKSRKGNRSFAQEGEDILLLRYFSGKTDGFFVDVGAHHPFRFSNTSLFYRQGWRGINVEPNPLTVELFRRHRPKDINIQCGVASAPGELNYFQFDDPALNTFDEALKNERLATTSYRYIDTVKIPVKPLKAILDDNLPAGRTIDFLTVDVEGLDLDVLQSNDWQTYRPHYVLAEALGTALEDIDDNAIYVFMTAQGYRLVAKTYNSLLFEAADV